MDLVCDLILRFSSPLLLATLSEKDLKNNPNVVSLVYCISIFSTFFFSACALSVQMFTVANLKKFKIYYSTLLYKYS